MPIEFERKYVLYCNKITTYVINETIKSTSYSNIHSIWSITQHYIQKGKGWNFRIRKSISQKDHNEIIYTSTFKKLIDGKIIEIESVIDESDYLSLQTSAITIIRKTRYIIPYNDHKWEIDFFYDHHKELYFIMAEIELKIFGQEISNIPDFIQGNLLYEVPLNDYQFSNEKMHDVEYVEKKYNKLLKDYNNEKQKNV